MPWLSLTFKDEDVSPEPFVGFPRKNSILLQKFSSKLLPKAPSLFPSNSRTKLCFDEKKNKAVDRKVVH